jgi:hypothetical protein
MHPVMPISNIPQNPERIIASAPPHPQLMAGDWIAGILCFRDR